jgi:FecR protein
MRLAGWKLAAVFLAAVLSVPAWGDTDSRHTAEPGALNYVEGQASIGDQTLDAKSVGTANLENGEELRTGNGKAEILLTPGVYLRLGDNSSVKMVSTNLTNTQVAVDQGEAMLEVDQIFPQNFIHISQAGADTRIMKTGLYAFDANGSIHVFEGGKAIVSADDRNVTVKGGHELLLNMAPKLKAQDFNKKEFTQTDDLYRWSSLRSEYLSEANIDTARLYYGNGWYGPGYGPGFYGAGYWGPGWFWDPWFAGFTFMPGAGFFYNPFGWGFYSPLMVYRAPFVGHGFHAFNGTRPVALGSGFHAHAVTAFRGNAGMGGFHGGGAPMHGGTAGGFHGGGFHGGGMR